ncbi:MAG: ABC transporter permease [Candidatus Kapaibacteriales bacterium]
MAKFFSESIRFAFDSIRSNKLRTFLTFLSISIGVFALTLAGTLISSLKYAVQNELANIGETTFWIQRLPKITTERTWRKYRKRKPITYKNFQELKKITESTPFLSATIYSMGETIKFGNLSTDPDVNLIGVDNNYFINNAVDVDLGRPITDDDVASYRNVAVIGNDVIVKIFPNINPIGKEITIKNQQFTVVGILKPKGAILGQSQDNRVLIPVTNFLRYFASEWESSVTISVKALNKEKYSQTIDEAIGNLRTIRNDKPWEDNSFEVETNETITQQFGGFVNFLSIFGFLSGGFALVAAGVGIMNIMLVAVKERTREIGIRKAVGAKRRWILFQFIFEAFTLTQIGGLIGLVIGLVGGYFFGKVINLPLGFPWFWVFISILSCTLIAVGFGAYPAYRAANLDPIEALRYE